MNDYEGYVGFETAKLLKQIGFNVICNACWSMYPHFEGEPLGCDEEYELISNGRENEITYEPYFQMGVNSNNAMWKNQDIWTCPKIEDVIIWFLHTYDIYVVANPYIDKGLYWKGEIQTIKGNTIEVFTKNGYHSRYEALNCMIYLVCEQFIDNIKK